MGLLFRIAIYGIGAVANDFYNMLKSRNEAIEIVYFVQTEKTRSKFHGRPVISVEDIKDSDFDKLVIATDIYYDEIIGHLKGLCNGYELYKKSVKYDVLFSIELENARKIMPFQSCITRHGISYIATSEDEYMLGWMFKTGENYSENLIQGFFDLTQKYYGRNVLNANGYFLDIGANFGTTSIYVKKNINRALHVIGFEPSMVNYNLFRVNCILNQVDDIKAECMGLSSSNTQKRFFYSPEQSGMSRIVNDDMVGEDVTIVNVVKLDDYLKKNEISPKFIDYIWIDAEGHEDEIIAGAMETMRWGGAKSLLCKNVIRGFIWKKIH